MKLHRFFIEQPLGEEIEIKEKSLLHQWNNVLRFKKGESLILFNSSHNIDYIYCLSFIEKGKAVLELVSQKENLSQEENRKSLTLCFSLIKRYNLDLVLEKCTEIGVLKFIPIISDRVEKKNIASFNKERGDKIIKEAVEQSGWGNIPKLNNPIKLEDLLKDLEKKAELENVIVMDIVYTISKEPLSLQSLPKWRGENIYLFVGPEGGWTEKERGLFAKYKIKTINLGRNILRAETASIIGSYKILI